MPSDSKDPNQSADRLPFEPGQKKKAAKKQPPAAAAKENPNPKPAKPASAPSAAALKAEKILQSTKAKKSPAGRSTPSGMAIPDVVSKRMARRMATFCGIPTGLGMLSFVVSYFIVQQGIKLPNVAVLLVSMGCFGLGVIGLSYGLLSASWDEDRDGSWLGWDECTTNFARLREAWKEARQKKLNEKS